MVITLLRFDFLKILGFEQLTRETRLFDHFGENCGELLFTYTCQGGIWNILKRFKAVYLHYITISMSSIHASYDNYVVRAFKLMYYGFIIVNCKT